MTDLEKIKKEVKFSAVRSRGPGGQNVNKVSSAAILLWDYLSSPSLSESQKISIQSKLASFINKEGIFYIRSDEFRDLEKNKARCLDKLKGLLAKAFHTPRKRKPTTPSKESKRKRRESKSRRSDLKKNRQKVR